MSAPLSLEFDHMMHCPPEVAGILLDEKFVMVKALKKAILH